MWRVMPETSDYAGRDIQPFGLLSEQLTVAVENLIFTSYLYPRRKLVKRSGQPDWRGARGREVWEGRN